MAKCCICDRHLEGEDGPVLAMGAAGVPRLLCDDCAALLDTATEGRDYDEIKAAMEKLGKIMADNDPDSVTYSIVSGLMVDASERAKAIKDGSYDFDLDLVEEDDGGLEEIPEEMLETEEDKEKDVKDEEKMKRFDKIYNIILGIVCAVTAGLIIWKLLDTFVF